MHGSRQIATMVGLALMGSSASHAAPLAKNQLAGKTTIVRRLNASLDNIPDWSTFYAEFRRAVERRDRRLLRTAMDENFRYTFDRTPGGDPREEALEYWDREGVQVWASLSRILHKGNRNDPEVPGLMVSPPAWVEDQRYIGYRAGFMKVGGNWRWIWYVTGDY
jgi:hypothetical protein